ncbi:Xaa-Pro peptidase family protein [Vibrio sp. EA2]|uniref:M24 family metallopeptidase n=1 Tax=Vibrio sp. EA2 TaxID=3079860 RepID=UPI0029495351|nr:Xaa-Pro peptidase family protein [Vibrio sp. EA2]MDV6253464.1 Xaa-Pro peptidase family protein [Vibrio sp. EA2]
MILMERHTRDEDMSWADLIELAPESAGIDLKAVRAYRLERVREQMRRYNLNVLILSDAVNIRYTTGARNMQVFCSRNSPSRYLVLTEHKSILFEFTGCEHLADGLETIDEVRPAETASFVAAGPHIRDREAQWTHKMIALMKELVGSDIRLGIERMNAGVAIEFAKQGITVSDAQEPVEMARSIKSGEEVKCMVASLRATEQATGKLREAIRPGITESELWAVLHKEVIARNGDYVETRLLSSGSRTNPWFQESANRVIGKNELIGLDTDVVGCHGYYSDFSRTFHSGPDAPSDVQRTLYKVAYEQIQHNIGIIKPGMSFREYADKAWNIPEKYHTNRYYLSAHGVGMSGEYPYLYHRADFPDAGYDGIIKPNMTLCVESYIGEHGGREGVKLEEQLLVTETGIEILTQFPFEDELLR